MFRRNPMNQTESQRPSQSFESILADLDELHALCAQDPELSAVISGELSGLRRAVKAARSAKDRQACLELRKRKATADSKAQLAKGRDLAIRIRSGVVAVLGPRSPRLADFKINRWTPDRA
jgi:hypothetical protein